MHMNTYESILKRTKAHSIIVKQLNNQCSHSMWHTFMLRMSKFPSHDKHLVSRETKKQRKAEKLISKERQILRKPV